MVVLVVGDEVGDSQKGLTKTKLLEVKKRDAPRNLPFIVPLSSSPSTKLGPRLIPDYLLCFSYSRSIPLVFLMSSHGLKNEKERRQL